MNNKKLIVIIAAALALLVGVTIVIVACTQEGTNSGNNGGNINIGGDAETDENGNVINGGEEMGTGNQKTEIGDPVDYTYTECDQTVYVNNPNSAVTLRSENYEALGSVAHGTELRRIGLSTDNDKCWSKVIYDGKEYYIVSKFIATITDANADEGFVAIDKTVVVNDKTGSLNIRNIPVIDGSQIIGWAVAGTEYKVVAENATTGWYKIEFIPYGSTEIAYGYIKSGADNFVKQENADDSKENDTTDTNGESDSNAPEGSGSGK